MDRVYFKINGEKYSGKFSKTITVGFFLIICTYIRIPKGG
jgi:hypothetical protein